MINRLLQPKGLAMMLGNESLDPCLAPPLKLRRHADAGMTSPRNLSKSMRSCSIYMMDRLLQPKGLAMTLGNESLDPASPPASDRKCGMTKKEGKNYSCSAKITGISPFIPLCCINATAFSPVVTLSILLLTAL